MSQALEKKSCLGHRNPFPVSGVEHSRAMFFWNLI